MSEEEEAIEYIKELIKPPLREEWDFAYKLDKTTAKQFKVLVKCIDKLQKENEDMREELQMYVDTDVMILQKELKDSINARFELQRRIDRLQKENEALKEVHKEFATLCRKLKTDDTLMSAKSVMEKVVSKDKVKEILIRNKKALKLAQEQIEEEIIIADSDSLNAGRIQAHSLIITDLEKLLGDDKDE